MARTSSVPTETNLTLLGLDRVLEKMVDEGYLFVYANDIEGVKEHILSGSGEHWFSNGAGEVKIFVSAFGSVIRSVTLVNFRHILSPSITALFDAAEGTAL